MSPQQGTPWRREHVAPLGETYRLEARPGDLESGHGIFASSYYEAVQYGDDIYLVAPDPKFSIVEGADGWRAGAAFVVAGPFDDDNLQDAQKIILDAYRAGYPQIEDILQWAAFFGQDAEVLAQVGLGAQLYWALCHWPDDKFNPAITEALCRTGQAELILAAACKVPDERFSTALIDALVVSGKPKQLYRAGMLLPEKRWSSSITNALVSSGHARALCYAACRWPDSRFTPALVEALIKTYNPTGLYYAGLKIPPERWDKRIAVALINTQSTDTIISAAALWPQERRTLLNV